jgi:methylmalonyl-CoA mutase
MFKKILIANRGEIACRDAGVQGIYGPGSNIVECAADVLRLLGHNMPPVEE